MSFTNKKLIAEYVTQQIQLEMIAELFMPFIGLMKKTHPSPLNEAALG